MSLFDISDSSEDEMEFMIQKKKNSVTPVYSIDSLIAIREKCDSTFEIQSNNLNETESKTIEDLKRCLKENSFEVSVFSQQESHFPQAFFSLFPDIPVPTVEILPPNHCIHKLSRMCPEKISITSPFLFSLLFTLFNNPSSSNQETLMILIPQIVPKTIDFDMWLSTFLYFARNNDSLLIYLLLIANPTNFSKFHLSIFTAFYSSLFCSSIVQHSLFYKVISHMIEIMQIFSNEYQNLLNSDFFSTIVELTIKAFPEFSLSIIPNLVKLPYYQNFFPFLVDLYSSLIDFLMDRPFHHHNSKEFSSILDSISHENLSSFLTQKALKDPNDSLESTSPEEEKFLKFSGILVLIEKLISTGVCAKVISIDDVKKIIRFLQVSIKTEDQTCLTELKEQLHMTRLNLELIANEGLRWIRKKEPLFEGTDCGLYVDVQNSSQS